MQLLHSREKDVEQLQIVKFICKVNVANDLVGVSESSHIDSLREAQSLKQVKSLEEVHSSLTLSINQIVSILIKVTEERKTELSLVDLSILYPIESRSLEMHKDLRFGSELMRCVMQTNGYEANAQLRMPIVPCHYRLN